VVTKCQEFFKKWSLLNDSIEFLRNKLQKLTRARNVIL